MKGTPNAKANVNDLLMYNGYRRLMYKLGIHRNKIIPVSAFTEKTTDINDARIGNIRIKVLSKVERFLS